MKLLQSTKELYLHLMVIAKHFKGPTIAGHERVKPPAIRSQTTPSPRFKRKWQNEYLSLD